MPLSIFKAPEVNRILILKIVHALCSLVSLSCLLMACLEPIQRTHPITKYLMQFLQSDSTGNTRHVDEFYPFFLGIQIFCFYLICALSFGGIAKVLARRIDGKSWGETFQYFGNIRQKHKVTFTKSATRSTYVEIDGKTFGFVARVADWPRETEGPRLVLGQLYTPIKGKRLDQHEFGPLEWYQLQNVSGTFHLQSTSQTG